ncbi:hypothetical protein ACVW0P_004392 [Mucilaginibacter sp. UYNi724]
MIMPDKYLHDHRDFPDLLRILEEETGIQSGLIEKDYWIMHVLAGLKSLDLNFELKGGTSLSKAYHIIDRFSEDIDIHITPPAAFGINENPKNNKPNNVAARKSFYDWLAENIKIDGIISVVRDHAFDDERNYRSGGIRLIYKSSTSAITGVKEGILLEVGFDTVTPNRQVAISSWAYDKASGIQAIKVIDNRAKDIICYHPGYTFVEKLQTIATKFRNEKNRPENSKVNFMRQYYDICCLLADEEVQQFIGTPEYLKHKEIRFPVEDFAIPLAENEAFLLNEPKIKADFIKRYQSTAALYYKGQPDFDELLKRIKENIHRF